MRILYGVQATGNGHITRARTMAKRLRQSTIQVDYLFSGRDRNKLFSMEPFGEYRCFRGLTFVTSKGKLLFFETWKNNGLLQFIRDVLSLDLSPYDLVLTDFEPISAWAAKLRNVPSIAFGHQYAFRHDVPKSGDNALTRFIMRNFAPAQICLGMHWHHFGQAILPPLIEPPQLKASCEPGKILVYLPFDDTKQVVQWLRKCPDYTFHVYCEYAQPTVLEHVYLHPFSRQSFQRDLASCDGVISNAGFGLSSEAMQYGKKILVKPLMGQMEQLSNAEALQQLNLGDVIHEFSVDQLRHWLEKPNTGSVDFPNVADAIVTWLETGRNQPISQLTRALWEKTDNYKSRTAI